jgi:hypothetical protein
LLLYIFIIMSFKMNLILEEILLDRDKEYVNHQVHSQLYKDKLS